MARTSALCRIARPAMVAVVLASTAAVAQAQSFFGTGAPVTVKYLGAVDADISQLWFKVGGTFNVGAYTQLFTNNGGGATAPGTQIILTPNPVALGVEVFFRLDNTSVSPNCPCSWYSGPGSRNSDGKVHVTLAPGSGGAASGGGNYFSEVNYESRYIPPADGDFNDLRFEVAGVTATGFTVTPEPYTISLTAAGLVALAFIARRRRV